MLPRRLRAPQPDGAVLAEPPLAAAGELLERNRLLFQGQGGSLLGRSWTDLRQEARQAAVAASQQYLRNAGEPVPPRDGVSLVMAGHQPEIFHAGVWVKNFALNALARRHGAIPINLIVDNDTAKVAGLHVPASKYPLDSLSFRNDPAVRLSLVPFDGGPADEPFEERTVHDEALFAAFPRRVAAVSHGWGFVPMLGAFWAHVLGQVRRTPLLGERLVGARRAWERGWGCHNLELPVSLLCQTEAFAWFACHLLANLASFHATYNTSVHHYRGLYGLHSRNHPVPDLTTESGWLELPFWAWRSGEKRRDRLFARVAKGTILLRSGNEVWPTLPFPSAGEGSATVAAWLRLEQCGLKVRSRALTNTLFARLFLADLFVHGIGGAKYDEVTDEIIRRFYGFEPPGYLVLSATLRPPFPSFPIGPEDCRQLSHELRDVLQNPQRHLDGLASPEIEGGAQELASEKQAWIGRPVATRRERRQRFHTLRGVTKELRSYLGEPEGRLRRRLVECTAQLHANEVLRRRDYAFCLFPEAMVRPFCTQFL
jgi:hypothetical protein